MRSSHPTGLHFHHRNPDPRKGDHGDCVVRAITLATGRPYDEVFNELARYMRAYGYSGTPKGGVPARVTRQWMKATHNWFYKSLDEGTTFKAENMPELCIAFQASHLVLVANGSIWDTWDSRGSRRKKLEGYLYPHFQLGTVAEEWVKTPCLAA